MQPKLAGRQWPANKRLAARVAAGPPPLLLVLAGPLLLMKVLSLKSRLAGGQKFISWPLAASQPGLQGENLHKKERTSKD